MHTWGSAEEGAAAAAWLEPRNSAAEKAGAAVTSARGSAVAETRARVSSAAAEGQNHALADEPVYMVSERSPALVSLAAASAALEQVTADGAGLLQQLAGSSRDGDLDEEATAAAKQGECLVAQPFI